MEYMLYEPREQYGDLVRLVRDQGLKTEVRGLATREILHSTIMVHTTRPALPIGTGRGVNGMFAALDALQLVAGVHRGDLMDAAAPGWRDVLVHPEDAIYGAYGPRTAGQFTQIYHHLREDPTSRRAVAVIWRPVDLHATGDRPCTLTFQFLLRDGRLDMRSSMRSQDVWLGFAYDLFTFQQLHLTMARWLDAIPDTLVHHVGSFHLYDRDLEAVDGLLDRPDPLEQQLPLGVQFDENPVSSALLLLNPDPGDELRRSNPWYGEQVAKIYARMNRD